MTPIVIWSVVFTVSLSVLIKGADIFTDQSGKLAKIIGIPDIVIGATLVALGTSLPELAACLYSVLTGSGEFVAGTVIGSNISNIAFILGATSFAFGGITISKKIFSFDLPMLILSVVLLSITSMDGSIGILEGSALFVMYLLYLFYIIRNKDPETKTNGESISPGMFFHLILSILCIYFGAEYTVRSVVELSNVFGFKDTSFMALTVVAIGSSLPELIVTVTAARKKMYDMSVGNIIGSNICNTFLITGLPSIIKPLPVTDAVFKTGIPFMSAITLAFYFLTNPRFLFNRHAKNQNGTLGRITGGFFLLIFILYLWSLTGWI